MTTKQFALRVIKPITVTDAMLSSTTVVEVAPAAYAGGTTYALGNTVSVAGTAGLQAVYESLQNANTGNTPASSPTWWKFIGNVYQAYNAGTTYALADRVQNNTTHMIYESLAAGNLGNALTDTTKWSPVSATNRWKLFDTSNSTQTAAPTLITYQFLPAQAVTGFAALNISNATSIRVRLTDPTYGVVFDRTTSLLPLPGEVGWWEWFFGLRTAPSLNVATDLPSFPNATLRVDIEGTTDLAVGAVLFGQVRRIGLGVNKGARVGIQDYSRKETNTYGDQVLVQRAYAKRASFDMLIEAADVDEVAAYLAGIRTTPCVWIGSGEYESTIVYGIFRDFDINIAYSAYSDCTLELLGLT